MLTKIRDNTWNVLNMQHITPNSKRWDYSDTPVVAIKRLKDPPTWLMVTTILEKSLTPTPWWRHQMETFSALLAICAGNSPVTGEFPTQRPVTRSFDVFFDLRLNKQSWGWWFETLSRPLWRQCNAESQHGEVITPSIKSGMKSFIHSQTSTVQPLTFGNGEVTSSPTLLSMWLLIQSRIKVNPW